MCVLLCVEEVAEAQPVFTQSLSPAAMGPGSTAALTFSIDNSSDAPAADLTFTAALPIGLTLATPVVASTNCVDGVLAASDGGSGVTLSGGRLGAGALCSVTVYVTATLVQSHEIVSGALTSSQGSSGTSSSSLEVDATRPGIRASFSDASIEWGEVTTLSFTIDNIPGGFYSGFLATNLQNAVVADPPNTSVTCPFATVTATAGTTQLSVNTVAFNAPGATCTVSVDIVPSAVGTLELVSGELEEGNSSSGLATARVQVLRNGDLHLTSEFLDDPVAPGQSARMRFTVWNFHRTLEISEAGFTVDLDAALSGLVATGLPAIDVCGVGSEVSGTSVMTFAGGTIAPEGSCTFSVPVEVPLGAVSGEYVTTTNAATGTLGGESTTGNQSKAKLLVNLAPQLNQVLTPVPVAAGSSLTIDFTLTNPSVLFAASDIEFSDNLSDFLAGTVIVSQPADGFCGPASQFSVFNDDFTGLEFSARGAELAAGASCVFQIEIEVPLGTPSGIYENATSGVSATVNGQTTLGGASQAEATVVGAPSVSKFFSLERVSPGDSVSLTYTIRLDENAPSDATAIALSDDFDAVISGWVVSGLPMVDVCGAGSQLTGTSVLTLSGASLMPAEECSFSVTLDVPIDAPSGVHTSFTSNITATVGGLSTAGLPASDDLALAQVLFQKDFLESPARAGQTVTLEYRIENISTEATSAMSFTDEVGDVMQGLSSTPGTVNDVCGAGSQLQVLGGGFLDMSGGSLAPGASCTFSALFEVPPDAIADVYNSTSSDLSVTFGSEVSAVAPARASLIIADPLLLTKSFAEASAVGGGTIVLDFVLANSDAAQAATALSFTDDLDAALPGLVAVGLPLTDVCGAGSEISGTDILSFSGGTLAAGQICSFSVTLQVPAGVSAGSQIDNVTSELAGDMAGVSARAAPGIARIPVDVLTLRKEFTAPVAGGASATLTFTIDNLQAETAERLRFSDDLEAMLTGARAGTLPPPGFCGPDSEVTGTSVLAVAIGTLAAGASCTFSVDVAVPTDASPGDYLNTTSALSLDGLVVGSPASAPLTVLPQVPLLSLAFLPDTVGPSTSSALTVTVDSSANQVPVTGLVLALGLPEGLLIDSATATTSCVGGVLEAEEGTSTVRLTDATVEAGSTCTIELSASADTSGLYLTTSTLTSEAGASTAAMTALLVLDPLEMELSFAPASIAIDSESTLIIDIDNGNENASTDLAFSATLPEGIVIAQNPQASNGCGGELVTASGTSTLSLVGGVVQATEQCTITLQVSAIESGTHVFELTLTSAGGASTTQEATLEVDGGGGGCGCSSTGGSRFPFEVVLLGTLWLWLNARRRRDI